MLSISEFINKNKSLTNINEQSKFWELIEGYDWVYVDDTILDMIGYSNEMKQGKTKYARVLYDHFIPNQDYQYLTATKFITMKNTSKIYISQNKYSTHNKTKHIILTPTCFKQSLLWLTTDKAKNMTNYFNQIESVFRQYLKYQEGEKSKSTKKN